MNKLLVPTERPICSRCELNLCKPNGFSVNGFAIYKKYCNSCHKLNCNEFSYRKQKEDKCYKCGFIPVHACQLDVDHIDGNRKNNDPKNLQTLCANCHRLKTYINLKGLTS